MGVSPEAYHPPLIIFTLGANDIKEQTEEKTRSIIIINKFGKTVEHHPFSYIESVAHIPLTFSTLEDLIIGNPIYTGDSIVAYRQTENHILIGTVGKLFKTLLPRSALTL